jgi:hypothetical protein
MGEDGVQLMELVAAFTVMFTHVLVWAYCDEKLENGVHCTQMASVPTGRMVLDVAVVPPTDPM